MGSINMDFATYTKIFENTVIPVMDYASGVWGSKRYDVLERLQYRAIRTFLGVGKTSPIPAITGDMGWTSILVNNQCNIVRLWCRLMKLPDIRISRKAVPVLFRIYVPFDVDKVREVSVLSKKTRYKTTHIPETFIWTVTIESVDRNIEFQIVVDYIKVSGLVFKEYNDDTLPLSEKGFLYAFYVYTDQLQADVILLKILRESKQTLLDKILRHLPHFCYFDEYLLIMKILLKNSEGKTEVVEKLTDTCRQKCSQCMVQETKNGTLVGLLDLWKAVQNLQPTTYESLLPLVEKGILECIGNDTKLTSFDKRPEFMHAVLEGPLFRSFESQFELLKRLADAKTNLRTCVVDLLAEERFQALPDDQYAKIVKLFLHNSLQIDKKKFTSDERIVKAYAYLCVLFKLCPHERFENLRTEIDEMVFKSVEQYNTKELMRAVVHIETNEDQQKLFQNHIKKNTWKALKEVNQGHYPRYMWNRTYKNTVKVCIISILISSYTVQKINSKHIQSHHRSFDISEDDKPDVVFGKALENASFWTEIFTAEGNEIHLQSVQKYKPCLKVLVVLAQFKRIIQTKQLNVTQIQQLKINESAMLRLLSCVLDPGKGETKQKLQSSWMKCYTTLTANQDNINLIREIFHTLKVRVAVEEPPPIVTQTLEFIVQIQSQIQTGDILVADIIEEETLGLSIKEISDYCRLLIKPVKSQVFWNILQDEFRQKIQVENKIGLEGNDDPLDGISLPEMFEEDYEPEIINSFNASKTISFITALSNNSLDKYRQVWSPYFKRENKPLEEFKKHLRG
ncbi:unnamed protein product [Mytilus edulis]|uniref:Uncharacterized protein n=1 Tax=Mytilus edulis TaxID=6550 RepID=A0A8S3RGS1_MYTED|nr:unnamed protein product [Mytilus edulis]